MANYLTTDTDLTAVADAIRTKGGTSASLAFPAEFVSAIEAIPTGGGGGDEVIRTEIIVNSAGDVNFNDVLTACQNMGYELTYKDCVLRFRAKGASAATTAPTNYTYNNHSLLVKNWLIWNATYNQCDYKSGKVSPDSFSGTDLWKVNNAIQNSGNLVDANHKLVNTYASAFQSMGGSGTTVVLYEIPVSWSDFLTTV